jgi:UDP-N-acetylmuramoylalanine--D-glutamate ligase
VTEKKYIFVYGAGISGQGVAEVLAKRGKKVILYNDEPREVDPKVTKILEKTGGAVIMKKEPTPYLKESLYMIISPGIPFTTATAQKAKGLGVEIIGEAEQAGRLYKGKWVGVTGTNGKTTTTTLLGEMLATLPVKTAVGGNIGFALSKETENLDANSYIAAELSSFQLEGTTSLRINIALILNITPDHIERHGNMENYIAAKAKIFAYQTKDDVLILNADDPIVKGFAPRAHGRVCFISCKKVLPEGVYIENDNFTINLDGKKQVVCPGEGYEDIRCPQ